MTGIRKRIAIALTALSIGFGVATTSVPAEAYFHHFGGYHFHSFHHWGHGWGHRWGYGWGHRWGWGHPCTFWRHECGGRVGFHWRGYRRAEAVETFTNPVCPAGSHLGYLGKHCWPNRR